MVDARASSSARHLPFDPRDLLKMRVSPAQFSRMVGVSKQAVSEWIKKGTVTIGPDGKLDPDVATRQYIERTDPARQRARVFRNASASHQQLRARVAELEAQLAAANAARAGQRERLQRVRHQILDDQAERQSRFADELITEFDRLVEARAQGRLPALLDRMAGRIFHGLTDEQLDQIDAEMQEDLESSCSGDGP